MEENPRCDEKREEGSAKGSLSSAGSCAEANGEALVMD